uniref:Uncharacterized protein LOC116956675 n=1 Tax=Petromyzon marinus TaxID=7757 RepID=A0AAJ7UFM1_PETMA|nr:uncharacterized protein LOC116956675 [Petromyzon marinus]
MFDVSGDMAICDAPADRSLTPVCHRLHGGSLRQEKIEEEGGLSCEEEDQHCTAVEFVYDTSSNRDYSTFEDQPPALPLTVEVKTGGPGEKSTWPLRAKRSRALRKGPRSKPRPRAHLQDYLKIVIFFLCPILFFQLVGDTAANATEPSPLQHLLAQGQVDGINWSCPNDETSTILVRRDDKLLVEYWTSGETFNLSYNDTSLKIVDWDWSVPSGTLLWIRSPEDGVYSVEARGLNEDRNTCIIAIFTAAAEAPTMPGPVQISYPSNETTSRNETLSHGGSRFVLLVPLVLLVLLVPLVLLGLLVGYVVKKRLCCKPETQREIDDDSCTTNGCLWKSIVACICPRHEYQQPQA